MPSFSPEEKAGAASQRKLRQLLAKRPSRITAKSMYVKDLMETATRVAKQGRRMLPKKTANLVFKKHGQRWAELARGHESQ
eukprot:10694450-Lingulodinium_polyedra.AAC.1